MKPWVRRLAWTAGLIAIVYGMVYADVVLRARNEYTPLAIAERVGNIVDGQRFSLSRPTETHREQYRIASEELGGELAALRALIDGALSKLLCSDRVSFGVQHMC